MTFLSKICKAIRILNPFDIPLEDVGSGLTDEERAARRKRYATIGLDPDCAKGSLSQTEGPEAAGICIWLDDVRDPPSEEWLVIRNSAQFTRLWFHYFDDVERVSFDHDLGEAHWSGLDCARLVDATLKLSDREHFCFSVHSANPVGARNIRRMLADWSEDTL